jgi:hypothetical protein
MTERQAYNDTIVGEVTSFADPLSAGLHIVGKSRREG